ncbi:thioredoxin family protein [candidate division WOR-3 bacterium]|nr:thioredoxin family protein [candidate division WOR-3 bacterium]
MALLSDSVRKRVSGLLDKLERPVRLVLFTQEVECPHCREARELAEEVTGLSDRLNLEVHNLQLDRGKAAEYGVERVPTLCVVGDSDRGIRFNGIPSGYEFTSLLAAIELSARADSGLARATRDKLAGLKTPVDIQVFVTLTCPYCPAMVTLAHRFAQESPQVSAAAVDAGEFPQLANLHGVMAVPRTVINHAASLDGVVPEEKLLEQVLAAAEG